MSGLCLSLIFLLTGYKDSFSAHKLIIYSCQKLMKNIYLTKACIAENCLSDFEDMTACVFLISCFFFHYANV